MLLDRSRREPKNPRRAVLAGSPSFPAPPKPVLEASEKPKKRASRKRAAKVETDE